MEAIGAHVPSFLQREEVPCMNKNHGSVNLPKRVPSSPLHFAMRATCDIHGALRRVAGCAGTDTQAASPEEEQHDACDGSPTHPLK